MSRTKRRKLSIKNPNLRPHTSQPRPPSPLLLRNRQRLNPRRLVKLSYSLLVRSSRLKRLLARVERWLPKLGSQLTVKQAVSKLRLSPVRVEMESQKTQKLRITLKRVKP